MTHLATVRVGTVCRTMFVFEIAGMISGSRGRAVAHNTVLGRLVAVVTLKAVAHFSFNVMSIQIFPAGNRWVTSGAVELLVLFVRKIIYIIKSDSFSIRIARGFHVAQTTITIFTSLKVADQAPLFARASKGVVEADVVDKLWLGCDYGGVSQRLPARW